MPKLSLWSLVCNHLLPRFMIRIAMLFLSLVRTLETLLRSVHSPNLQWSVGLVTWLAKLTYGVWKTFTMLRKWASLNPIVLSVKSGHPMVVIFSLQSFMNASKLTTWLASSAPAARRFCPRVTHSTNCTSHSGNHIPKAHSSALMSNSWLERLRWSKIKSQRELLLCLEAATIVLSHKLWDKKWARLMIAVQRNLTLPPRTSIKSLAKSRRVRPAPKWLLISLLDRRVMTIATTTIILMLSRVLMSKMTCKS